MKGKPVDEVVFDHLFPRPKPGEPQNFQALLQRNLIPEVRQETHSFYGHLDTQEAKYPGLDYSHPTHRMRLTRWPWHRRLFRAFDSLRLTSSEIANLTKWEGTKWAKEKYEKEQGVIIRDTTADGFPEVDEPASWRRSPLPARNSASPPRYHISSQVRDDTPTRISRITRPTAAAAAAAPSREDLDVDDEAEETEEEREVDEDEEEEEVIESVGVRLNERLRTQAARRDAGDTSAVLDEEWEQWLKTAIESGELAVITEHMTDQILRGGSSSPLPAALIPQAMLDLARGGQWSDIPEFLQPMLREVVRGESPPASGVQSDVTQEEQPSTPRSSRRQLTATSPRLSGLAWPQTQRQSYTALHPQTSVAPRTAEAPGA
jgi:anti-sigma28 factor (negative regulator of flagellin synthesis)